MELGKEELSGYVNMAENNLSKDFKIDGFRKGKVPKDLLRKNLGSQSILEVALDMAIKDSLSKVIREKSLEVLDASGLNIIENSPQKLVYKVSLTLFPDIKVPDLHSIKVKRKDVQVSAEEVTNTLEDIRSSRALFKDKDTPVEKGDRVEIDFEAILNGKPIEGGISKNHPLVVGKGLFMPGFEDKLIGMNKGEEKEFSLVAPEDYFNKDIAGKKLDFKVRMADVKKVELPTLDDNFAKTLGKFNNFDDLEQNIKEGIAEEKKSKERQRLLLEILEKITEKTDVEINEKMINLKLDDTIAAFDQDLHQRGMELSLYLARINKTQEDLRKDWRPNAQKQLKTSLILQKIAKDRKIEASESEISEAMSQTIQAIGLRGDVEATNLELEKLRKDVVDKIISDKTLAYIESICAI